MLARSRLAARQALRTFSTTPFRAAEVTLTVDGREVSIEAGSALIQAIEKAGVQVPRYCYHEKLAIAGNCRMCLVDLERAPKPVASCAFPVAPGQVVRTDTERVKKAREGVTEMILANHPLDCPVCDQGGECDLQEQTLRYGSDRGRFHEIAGKRAVEDKDIGPLIKTSMNRCIQCTRCVRFANDIAGAPELGTTGRGNDMQIGTYLSRNLNSEMSGNVIDLCPVGALTNKPYAFKARPWELKKTESIDVLDAVGSNIRVDSRGQSVLRVLPRLNDDVNEEWISDKTRFAVDGLNTQRLTVPLIKEEGVFKQASWEDVLLLIQSKFEQLQPKENEFKAVIGDLVDVESTVALKDLANRLGSENLAHDFAEGDKPLAAVTDFRSNYLFNATIDGIESADVILLVGTNPRLEAAVMNARIRKHWLDNEVRIGLVGPDFNSTFEYEALGSDATSLTKALKGDFGKALKAAKRPLIIAGSGIAESGDAAVIYKALGEFASANKNVINEEWNGLSVLQRAASRAGAYDVGFAVPNAEVAATTPKIVYLLGADEIKSKDLPKDAFVIYQGHNGDVGAPLADVILPGAAYTEKNAIYVNTEGRAQATRAAVAPPGAAREDWKIIKALSDVLSVPLPYENIVELRDRISEIAPNLLSLDALEPSVLGELAAKQLGALSASSTKAPLRSVVDNFYLTNSVARSSPTMAKSSAAFQL
ncbi:NADH-ubiquinone oxidoreductase subunit, mitochondrial [Wickerhamiella sorbophila]|uniref:NADH-ubiquinone oxidoreductase 78 kDa subunit, mitochondrial n=1 Tax=Wickerhamiella sorbophila TaxID=45607 RepID=A0A2T0FD31_9ASCO|nr:NADH-ubiquinone oxidoreductase subunit, mitochondrial [Wickerhamiella sorbophila]PRT52912.1 NADH-ubiquinone oxidoreductase subunit, mitochondrial [Wickerhamiella sorbophila]